MLYIRAYRDRLVNALFKNTEHEKLMKHWSAGQLIHWRWSSLSDVVEGFLEREQALRGSWDLSKKKTGSSPKSPICFRIPGSRQGEQGPGEEEDPRGEERTDMLPATVMSLICRASYC